VVTHPNNPQGTCRVKIVGDQASARTRRVVKKSAGFFEWYENVNRTDAILLRSPATGWFGWLPLDEIEFVTS
jgi:hypothetical protein